MLGVGAEDECAAARRWRDIGGDHRWVAASQHVSEPELRVAPVGSAQWVSCYLDVPIVVIVIQGEVVATFPGNVAGRHQRLLFACFPPGA